MLGKYIFLGTASKVPNFDHHLLCLLSYGNDIVDFASAVLYASRAS